VGKGVTADRFAVLNPRPDPKPQAGGKQIVVIDVIIGSRGRAFRENMYKFDTGS
jgi:hypothetical protein